MHFSHYGAVLGLLGLAVEASPTMQRDLVSKSEDKLNLARTSSGTCSCDLTQSWTDKVLYSGVIAAATDAAAAVDLGIALPEASVAGSVDLSCGSDFLLAPKVKIDLGGIQSYLKVSLDATAGVSESVNLFSNLDLSLAVPGLVETDIQVGVALDLVFSVSAALDIDTTFNIQFPEGCYIELDVLTQTIINSDLTGLIVESTPLSIGSFISLEEDIDFGVALRLRAGLGVAAGIDVVGIDIGAGAMISLWANLFEYTTTFSKGSSSSSCSAADAFSLTAGLLVDLDFELGAEVDLSLAPSVIVTLATAATETVTVSIGAGSSWSWPWISGSGTASGSGSGT
ncbi:hypothetical protein BD289DRAFT_454025, partial [Coniella lustricola]